MPWWLFWALLTPIVALLARRFRLDTRRWTAVLIHMAAAVVLSLIHLSLTGVLYYRTHTRGLPQIPNALTQIERFIDGYLILDLLAYGAIVGCCWAFDFYRRFRVEERAAAALQVRAARLESSMNQAKLDALRMELNPHFLFNTLNAISGLVRRSENAAAVSMLARLGDLLRATLDRDAGQEVPLETELDFLAGYLEIERIRFHDRLSVEMDVDPAALSALVPTKILQPLVENAVRHGIAPLPGPGRDSVGAHRENGRLVLVVRDTGGGFSTNGAGRWGVGLSNTRSRLEQLYGGEASLVIGDGESGGTVSVTLPCRTCAEEVMHDED
jgi:sensor histidine kinase YesM